MIDAALFLLAFVLWFALYMAVAVAVVAIFAFAFMLLEAIITND